MTDTVHPAAARGYAATADLYDRARPGYPEDAVAAIVERLDLRPGRTVLELGAGTGKLTTLPRADRGADRRPRARPGHAHEARRGARRRAGRSRSSTGPPRPSPCPRRSVDARRRGAGVPLVRRDPRPVRGPPRPPPRRPVRARVEPARRVGAVGQGIGRPHPHARRRRAPGLGRRVARVAAAVRAVRAVGQRPVPPDAGAHARGRARPGRVGELRRGRRAVGPGRGARERRRAAPRRPGDGRPRHDRPPVRHRGHVGDPPHDRARPRRRRRVRQPQPGRRAEAAGRRHRSSERSAWTATATTSPTSTAARRPRSASTRRRRSNGYGPTGTSRSRARTARTSRCSASTGPGSGTATGSSWAIGDGDGDGAGPLLELTQFAAPCATQSHWFVEGRIARISHKVRPEDARWYARVLREGPVAPGMAVRVVRDA